MNFFFKNWRISGDNKVIIHTYTCIEGEGVEDIFTPATLKKQIRLPFHWHVFDQSYPPTLTWLLCE